MSTARKAPVPRKRAADMVRVKTALELRVEGKTFAQIGEELGITKQSAHESVGRALAEVARDRRGLAQHVLDLELERVDFVMRSLAPGVEAGDHHAATAYLRAMERAAKLQGLDAPDKHEHSGLLADPTVIHARLGALAARAARGADADAAREPERSGED